MQGAESILQKVREQIYSRGARTIRSLGMVFRQLDSFDGNKKVNKNELYIGLKECGCTITQQEASELLQLLDTNKDGNLDYEEFLIGIRGKPNEIRQQVIDRAFQKFDKDGSGSITSADMRGIYSAKQHPKVKNGQMTEEQVFEEFLKGFGDVNKDGIITRDEWNDYYAGVSASVDNDDNFVLIIKNAWKLN